MPFVSIFMEKNELVCWLQKVHTTNSVKRLLYLHFSRSYCMLYDHNVVIITSSVRSSVTLCIVGRRYVLQQMWIGSAPKKHRFTTFNPLLKCIKPSIFNLKIRKKNSPQNPTPPLEAFDHSTHRLFLVNPIPSNSPRSTPKFRNFTYLLYLVYYLLYIYCSVDHVTIFILLRKLAEYCYRLLRS